MTAVTLIEPWPENLRSRTLTMHLRPNLDVGPTMRDGRRQMRASSAGYWIAEMTFQLYQFEDLRTYIGLVAKSGGGLTEFHVPNRRARQLAPWPDGYDASSVFETVTLAGGVTLANGVTFSRKIIRIDVRDAASAGATRLIVRAKRAGTLKRGMAFSVTDSLGRKRHHEVTEPPVTVALTADYRDWQIDFMPPLRSGVRATQQTDWENPSCVMKFADPMTGILELRPFMNGEPKVAFRESFDTR